MTVVQTHLPTVGGGALKSREDPNERAGKVRLDWINPLTGSLFVSLCKMNENSRGNRFRG